MILECMNWNDPEWSWNDPEWPWNDTGMTTEWAQNDSGMKFPKHDLRPILTCCTRDFATQKPSRTTIAHNLLFWLSQLATHNWTFFIEAPNLEFKLLNIILNPNSFCGIPPQIVKILHFWAKER